MTTELCEISLLDAAHLQEEDARFANKMKFSKHKPALPLFTTEDAEQLCGILSRSTMTRQRSYEMGHRSGF